MTELTQIRKFFVAYSWQSHAGFGPGHAFVFAVARAASSRRSPRE